MAPMPKSYLNQGAARQSSKGREEAKMPSAKNQVISNRARPTQPNGRSGIPAAKPGVASRAVHGGATGSNAAGLRQNDRND